MSENVNRRNFIKSAVAAGATLGAARSVLAQSTGRVIGPNDKIQLGIIGVGGRGAYLARQFSTYGEKTGACKIVAVCDVWAKRKNEAGQRYNCESYLDYRDVIARNDVDAIVV